MNAALQVFEALLTLAVMAYGFYLIVAGGRPRAKGKNGGHGLGYQIGRGLKALLRGGVGLVASILGTILRLLFYRPR